MFGTIDFLKLVDWAICTSLLKEKYCVWDSNTQSLHIFLFKEREVVYGNTQNVS